MALCEKQSNKVAGKALCKCAAGSHNVCEAPLCGSMSKHFTFIRKICSFIHLQYLCEELCFAIAFCEYEAYQGAASRCHISRFCLGKNISLLRGRYARILLALIRAKISRSAQGYTVSHFAYCALAQDIRVQRHAARTGAIKGAWESDAFACRFGRRRRR